MAVALLAQALLECGDLVEAERVVAETIARARAEQAPIALTEALRVAALISLRRVRLDAAAASLDEALVLARQLPYPYQEARLLFVCGLLVARRGRVGTARGHLVEASQIFRRLGAHKDLERTEHLLTTSG